MERRLFRTFVFFAVCLTLAAEGAASQSAKSFKVDRKTEMESLRRVLRDDTIRRNDPDRVYAALERVGELDGVEAIDEVIALLAMRRTYPDEVVQGVITRTITPGKRFPAMSTLARLGTCSVPALIDVIARTPPESQDAKLAAYAIFLIYRDDRKIGSDRVMHALFRYPDTQTKLLWFQAAATRIEEGRAPDARWLPE